MSQDQELFQAVVGRLAEEQRQGQEHPLPEDLLSYQRRELDDLAHDRVQAHLTVCHSCAQTLLDVANFPEVEATDPARAVSEEEVYEDLHVIREEIRRSGLSRWPLLRTSLALAASLFVAVGAAGWVKLLLPEKPLKNITMTTIHGGRERGAHLSIPPSSEFVTLILEDVANGYAEFEVEILDATGKVLQRVPGLIPSELNDVSLGLYSRSLETGKHELKIFGKRGETALLLETRTLYIE